MESTLDLKETIEAVTKGADANSDDVRFIKKMEIGQVWRQGDIYGILVPDDHPHGKLLESNKLAVGNSKGARHTAESKAKCYEGTTLPDFCKETAFLGPCVVSEERFTVFHEEHSDICTVKGTYQILHQADYQTQQRVQD